MRVLHIIPFLWSGAGNVVTRLAVSQRESGEVGVATSGHSKGQSDWPAYRARLAEAGVRHFEIDLFDRDPAVFWPSVGRLGEAAASFRPDLVHCHSGVPAAAAAIVRESARPRFQLVGQLHSWGTDRPEWMNRMDLWGFGRCDRIICNAGDYRRILRDSGIPGRRIVTIPWGLPLEEIQLASGVQRNGPGRRIGFVGRIEPRKRQLDLIETFKRLDPVRWGARLELIGPVADRQYAAAVRRAVADLDLGMHVAVKGKTANVYRQVRNWDLFVSLSRDEGQGMAILEAMALGTPVVSSGAAGVIDYLEHRRNGLLVRPATPENAAENIRWAFEHPAETARMADRARRMVERRYRWKATLAAMERLYRGG